MQVMQCQALVHILELWRLVYVLKLVMCITLPKDTGQEDKQALNMCKCLLHVSCKR